MEETTAAYLAVESLLVLIFVRDTKVSDGKKVRKWEMYLHALRLLKINTYHTVLVSPIQMQMQAEIQPLEYSPPLKRQL